MRRASHRPEVSGGSQASRGGLRGRVAGSGIWGILAAPFLWFRSQFKRLMRYAAVSVVSTATSLTVLGLLVGVANAPAGWANVVATSVATIPSFELNRRWVWSRRGSRSPLREVAPFVGLSLIGLALSTLNVHLVAVWATSDGWSRLAKTLAVEATNVGTFGLLWVFQFLLCDKILFKPRPAQAESAVATGLSGALGSSAPSAPSGPSGPSGVPVPAGPPASPASSARAGPDARASAPGQGLPRLPGDDEAEWDIASALAAAPND